MLVCLFCIKLFLYKYNKLLLFLTNFPRVIAIGYNVIKAFSDDSSIENQQGEAGENLLFSSLNISVQMRSV